MAHYNASNNLTAVFSVGDTLYATIEQQWIDEIVRADREEILATPPKLGELSIRFSGLGEDPVSTIPVITDEPVAEIRFSGFIVPEKVLIPNSLPAVNPFEA